MIPSYNLLVDLIIEIYISRQTMGSQAIVRLKSEQPITLTRFGVAQLNVLRVYRFHVSRGQTYECYVTLTVTNQTYRTKQFDQCGYPFTDDIFSFVVNSRYQSRGRALIVEFWEKTAFCDTSIGIGMVDFNALLEGHHQQSVKVFLNDKQQKVGWVQITCKFQQVNTQTISLVFDKALVRHKTASVMQCKIRATIGEEILQTKVVGDQEQNLACWKQEILTFQVLRNVKQEAKIVLVHETTEIGCLSLNLTQILQSKEQLIEVRDYIYTNRNSIAGTLRFFITKGKNSYIHVDDIGQSVYVDSHSKPQIRSQVINNQKTITIQPSVKSQLCLTSKEQQQAFVKHQQELIKIKNEYQEIVKLIQTENTALLASERTKVANLAMENQQIKLQLQRAKQKAKEAITLRQDFEAIERDKQYLQLKEIIFALQKDNQKMKQEQRLLSQQIIVLQSQMQQPLRSEQGSNNQDRHPLQLVSYRQPTPITHRKTDKPQHANQDNYITHDKSRTDETEQRPFEPLEIKPTIKLTNSQIIQVYRNHGPNTNDY